MPELSPDIDATLTDAYHAATERNAEPTPAAPPELPRDATPAERAQFENGRERQLDAELTATYNRVMEREALDARRNPALPRQHFAQGTPNGVKLDAIMHAAAEWQELPIRERRAQSANAEQIELAKRIAQELGMPAETAADVLAVLDKINGGSKQAAHAAPDPMTQHAFDTIKSLVPQARDHAEALAEIAVWDARIKQNPREWGTMLRQRYGISPAQLLTEQEAANVALAFYGIPAGRVIDMAQAPHFVPATRLNQMISDFAASKPDFTPQLRAKMAELIASGKIRSDGWPGLEEAYQQARRYPSTRQKPDADADLKAVARRHYG